MTIKIFKIILISLLITFFSSFWHDVSEKSVIIENCEVRNVQNCSISIITAGFPIPFLFDNPNIAGRGYISLNDNFELKAFLYDWLLFVIIVFLIFFIKQTRIVTHLVKLFLFSLILTLGSCQYQRPSKEIPNIYFDCNIPHCTIRVLSGGFPLPYIFDIPSISIRNSLSIEDDWYLKPFLGDFSFFFLLLIMIRFISKIIKNTLRNDRI
jgi:hypothetical protein